jgi:phosphatidylglycerophosphatase A
MGTGEIILAAVLVLVLFSARVLLRTTIRTREQTLAEVKLWIAQGFGAGRIPFAPGTAGSIVGLLWFALLVTGGSFWLFLFGTLVGFVVSVWLCDAAERLLAVKDPGSVVLDEIVAMPLCFVAWMVLVLRHTGSFPQVSHFMSNRTWLFTLAIFGAFRLFDVWKPWPVRQTQSLPGGWGITVDDALAAVYVNLVVLLFYACKNLWPA